MEVHVQSTQEEERGGGRQLGKPVCRGVPLPFLRESTHQTLVQVDGGRKVRLSPKGAEVVIATWGG